MTQMPQKAIYGPEILCVKRSSKNVQVLLRSSFTKYEQHAQNLYLTFSLMVVTIRVIIEARHAKSIHPSILWHYS
jgi:hypothetical protein